MNAGWVPGVSSNRFNETAADYAATMAPSLRPIAAEVARLAALEPGQRVLDVGTGTGIAAAAARGHGRTIIGIDTASGMLDIARSQIEDVEFREMDFADLAFEDAEFDAVLAAHALLFATDRHGVMREWRRVTRPGGRLSVSVPGPVEVTPTATYGAIYERHGIDTAGRYPTPEALITLAVEAGWHDATVTADPSTAIRLIDEAAFRIWREIGSRGAATATFTPEQHRALTDEMLAATPREPDGTYVIPFGALFLTARRPDA